jgi:hypothetical protein
MTQNCTYFYVLDGRSPQRVGSTEVVVNVTTPTLALETAVLSAPPQFTRWTNASFTLRAFVSGAVTTVDTGSANVTVEVNVDGAGWLDVRTASLPVVSFNAATGVLLVEVDGDGEHVLLARTRVNATVDVSPSAVVWTVDRTPPTTWLWTTPAAAPAAEPLQCRADFSLAADESVVFEVQWRATNTSAGDNGTVVSTAWKRANATAMSLGELAGGVRYVFHARAVDATGNIGPPSSWYWTSPSCPLSALVPVPLRVDTIELDVSTARGIMWAVGASAVLPTVVEYRVYRSGDTKGAWLRTSARPIRVTMLDVGVLYIAEVRKATPCGCGALADVEQPATSTSWLTYGPPPGRVVLLSAPTVSTNSDVALFSLASTLRHARLQHSLDGAAFSSCGPALRLGPLAIGRHNVSLRSVDAAGDFIAALDVHVSWTIVSLSSSSMTLQGLGGPPLPHCVRGEHVT